MLSHFLKCRKKNTESKSPMVEKVKNGRIMLLSNCAVQNRKNQDLLKKKKLVVF